ncbi:uncharacterized protein ACNLHF_013638 isoform 1-T2 [Anomaloglossus baeobatrachus]|uniref:uncharacterized protein LOC142296233 n=1 Tax=Anomaloglossus baeobatrachus TaxID=238106 RepID=UPI003F4FBE0E
MEESGGRRRGLRFKKDVTWYHRMGIDVKRLIELVETMPILWDSTTAGYNDRQRRNVCWTDICKELYPLWDEADCTCQLIIDRDVRKRWRSVRDRFNKCMLFASRHGFSTPPKKCPFFDQLQFTLTNPGASSAAETSTFFVPSQNVKNTQRKKFQNRSSEEKQIDSDSENIPTEELNFIENSSFGDRFDHFSYTLASRLREMPKAKQSSCMAAVYTLFDTYESHLQDPSLSDIVIAIQNTWKKSERA